MELSYPKIHISVGENSCWLLNRCGYLSIKLNVFGCADITLLLSPDNNYFRRHFTEVYICYQCCETMEVIIFFNSKEFCNHSTSKLGTRGDPFNAIANRCPSPIVQTHSTKRYSSRKVGTRYISFLANWGGSVTGEGISDFWATDHSKCIATALSILERLRPTSREELVIWAFCIIYFIDAPSDFGGVF